MQCYPCGSNIMTTSLFVYFKISQKMKMRIITCFGDQARSSTFFIIFNSVTSLHRSYAKLAALKLFFCLYSI